MKQTNVRLSEKAKEQIKALREKHSFLKSDAAVIEFALNIAGQNMSYVSPVIEELVKIQHQYNGDMRFISSLQQPITQEGEVKELEVVLDE
jgi:hypothetical protein